MVSHPDRPQSVMCSHYSLKKWMIPLCLCAFCSCWCASCRLSHQGSQLSHLWSHPLLLTVPSPPSWAWPHPQHLAALLSHSAKNLLHLPQHLTAHIFMLPLLVLLTGVRPFPSWPLPLPQCLAAKPPHSSPYPLLPPQHLEAVFLCCLLLCCHYILAISTEPCSDAISVINRSFTSSTAPLSLHSWAAYSHASRKSMPFPFVALFITVKNRQPMVPAAPQKLWFFKEFPILLPLLP